jgi:hypothetical protein
MGMCHPQKGFPLGILGKNALDNSTLIFYYAYGLIN